MISRCVKEPAFYRMPATEGVAKVQKIKHAYVVDSGKYFS